MKKIITFLIFIIIASCGTNCEEIPNSFSNYNQAQNVVLSSNFKFTDKADVSNSSWITSAKYLSCDKATGFFIITTGNRTYIHQNLPLEVWEQFKKADSKGKFYNQNIKGKYQLELK